MASQRDPHSRELTRTLPERVGQLYYSHGLFCSSHPVPVIVFAVAVVLLCCYPLLNLPMPGNVPQQLSGNLSLHHSNGSEKGPLPQWFIGSPILYVQQVIVKTAVSPWTNDMILTDAFRAPLAEVFKLLEVIQNFQHGNSSKTLSQLCLHVESVKTKSDKKLQLPEYNCLVLSPANLWQQNRMLFQDDPNLLGTIFSYQNLQKGKISLAEMLFGMNIKDTGIKRYPLRTRQRVLQFAVTIILKENDKEFLHGLQQKLTTLFPLHQPSNTISQANPESNDTNSGSVLPNTQEIFYIYYPGEFNIGELVPLTVTYFILFLYIYFSVRKIELVKSKVGMAFSAVMTVLASLFMSVGLCFFFGLTLKLNGKDVFPYLIVAVGLENVLVLTKSVVSTPTHLDVKIRVAQGLSREGWSITKNLLTEVTILTIGLFTFVPAIQKFCIFAIVGLLSDFFLQMFFFSTVLAIDIRRMELSSETHHRMPYSPPSSNSTSVHQSFLRQFRSSTPVGSPYKVLSRSKSHPRLNGLSMTSSMISSYPTNVVATPHNSPPILVKLPKRLRLVHFWARTRIFQRMFMLCMVVWISFIVYSSGIVEQLLQVSPDSVVSEKVTIDLGSDAGVENSHVKLLFPTIDNSVHKSKDPKYYPSEKFSEKGRPARTTHTESDASSGSVAFGQKLLKNEGDAVLKDDLVRLKHTGFDPWRRLSHHHWPAILSLYNVSLAGHYISILPAIRLSLAVSPDTAHSLRNLDERSVQHFQWQALAAALDPLDFSDGESGKMTSQKTFLGSDVPFVPSSPMELFLTALLCIVSVVVLAYTMVVLYRCVCTRNYAEWRASWAGEHEEVRDGITQVVMEAVPLVLEGHNQEVECLSTDGTVVVSSCLAGQLHVWDSLTGESLVTIDRRSYFLSLQKSSASRHTETKAEDLPLSDYESGSPPSRGEISEDVSHRPESAFWDLPDLRSTINTNFMTRTYVNSQDATGDRTPKKGFDYGSKYDELYKDYKYNYNVDSTKRRATSIDKSAEWNARVKDKREVLESDIGEYMITPSTSLDNLISSSGTLKCDAECESDDTKVRNRAYNKKFCERVTDVECASCVWKKDSTPSDLSNQSCDCAVAGDEWLRKTYISSVGGKRGEGNTQKYDVASSEIVDNNYVAGTFQSSHNWAHPHRAQGDEYSAASHHHEVPRSSHLPASPSTFDIKTLSSTSHIPTIWCLDCHENLIVIGCATGRIEFWEGSTGKLKCVFEDGNGVGVTAVKIIGNRVVAAKLSGAVDFLELESFSQGQPIDWGFTSYRRTHVRTNSAGALSDWEYWTSQNGMEEDIRCVRLNTTKAHQQPITVLDSEGGRVLTGSQDHTLKVFRLEDQLPLYTLHGHSGPISCLFIDRISPMMSGSGSQDGLLCVWDLLTGACMYSIHAHDGSVVTLTYSASYVISLGTDERLCVWERFQGHLLNTIQVAHTYCSSMVMLTHNLLITSKQGSLVVWDVRTGVPLRIVRLGHSDKCVFVKQILLLGDSVVCDYSNQLRIVRFPLVTDKCD